MNTITRKVGRFTVAAGLVALGAALLMDNLLGSGPAYTSLTVRFWPVLLIGFGAEHLIFSMLDRAEDGRQIRLRFDIGGAILLFLLVALTAGFHTLSSWVSLHPRDYVMTTGGSGRSETASVPANGAKEVKIDIDLGRVELYSQKLSEVRVEASYDMLGMFILRDRANAIADFKLTAEGGETIRIRGEAPGGVGLGKTSATYRIYVPADLKVQVRTGAGSMLIQDYQGELNLNSRVGSITVTASAGRLDLESGSGSIHVSDHTGPVTVKTNVGRVELQRVIGALQADSGTGSIRVDDWGGGKLIAETRTGSITVSTGIALEGDLLLRTSTGSINLTLPEGSSMKVTAQTKTGSITAPPFVSVSKNGTSNSAVGSSGDGKHLVTLETGLGSIHFNSR